MTADSRCHNQYIAAKLSLSYDLVKSGLLESVEKKSSAKATNALESLTFFKGEKDLLDSFLSMFAISDDRKVLRLSHYFLTELSQFKFTNSADAKSLSTTFTKEIAHKDLARRVSAIKNYALLAPSDTLTNANIMETISSIIRKGDDGDKEKKKRGFFSRGPDAGRERALLQYAALCACRHRFVRPQSLFMPILEAIRCNDSVGARHAVALTVDYAKEAPVEVASNIKRFLPHLKGKEAVYLTDTVARVYFTSLSAIIGLKADEVDFFQSLIQSLLDINPRVAFEAMTALSRFPWPKLEKATVLNIIPDVPDGAPQLHETIANPIPVLQAITTRLSTTLSPSNTPALLHAASRVTRILATAYHDHLASSDQPVNQQQLSNPTPTTKFPSLELRDLGANPLAPLTVPLVTLLSAPSAYVRAQALKALVWLTMPTTADTQSLQSIFAEHSNNLPAPLLFDALSEVHTRIQTMPRLSCICLDIVYDWFNLVPEKVNVSLVFKIWKTVVRFGQKGREFVLKSIYRLLDRDIKSHHRVINLTLRSKILWFLGDNANLLADEYPERYLGQNSPMGPGGDIPNGALKAIILRLSNSALFEPWETRSICAEGLAKIAVRSGTAVKLHIFSFATVLAKNETGSCVTSTASLLLAVLTQQLEARKKWLPVIKSTPPDSIPAEQLSELFADHERLHKQSEVFCSLPKVLKIECCELNSKSCGRRKVSTLFCRSGQVQAYFSRLGLKSLGTCVDSSAGTAQGGSVGVTNQIRSRYSCSV